MDIVVAFIAGVALTVLWKRLLLWQSAPDPVGDVQPQVRLDRIQELTPVLAAAGDASAHPRDLKNHPAFKEVVAILQSSDLPLSVAADYAMGAVWVVSAAGCAALAERSDREEVATRMERHLRNLTPWPVFYALHYFTSLNTRPPVGALFLGVPDYWADSPVVPALFAEHLVARAELGDPASFGDSLTTAPSSDVGAAEVLLRKVAHPSAQTLIEQLSTWRRQALDRQWLQTFGRFLERTDDDELLVEHAAVREELIAAESLVFDPPHRSMLVVGDPRLGKSSFLALLRRRAAARGWAVFEAGAAALMSGQQYFGQLEERMRRLLDDLAVDKRVLWQVPDFLQLAASGKHQGQAESLLDQVLPAVTSGKLVLLSEITPAGVTTLLQRRPALRSSLEFIRLRSLDDGEVNALVSDVASRLPAWGATADAGVLETITHLARHYLGTEEMPGAALDLLKLAARRVTAEDRTEIRREDVLATLAQITGMPALVLDDRQRVDLAGLRTFFTSRVIGQDEAINAVVDRIAMLKAGLTDPHRPIGVFLFAGPTGTGKTELAKTLAEFLFGSPDRMIRLDMSEFQALESTRKIVGDPDQAADARSLTQRVRNQPFSVVLLDEFEKAHPNAWDLFLQVFDDGRLTDAAGHTVDFRHCIIILTSNLGSTIPQGGGLGFVAQGGSFSQEHVMRAIGQSFRPEFVNRLDAIIVFRPLTRDLMRGILTKELAHVLERRGLRDREWAVEWESSALDFLLDKGFSPAMGARPLKRAIDRYLLAPLASTLVEHRFPEGDQFLFVRSDGRAIQVEFVDPEAPTDRATLTSERSPSLRVGLERIVLQAVGSAEERLVLESELQRMEERLVDPAWTGLETELVERIQQQDFWNQPGRVQTLSQYELLDRVRAAAITARSLASRLARSGAGRQNPRDLVSRLASQLYLVHHGIEDVLQNAPVEIILSVQPMFEPSDEEHATDEWNRRVINMYRRWASRRNMHWQDIQTESKQPIVAVLAGFGVHRILAREVGLHVLEYERASEQLGRAVARVRVVATPEPLPESQSAAREALLNALDCAASDATVIRRYRLGASPLVRDVPHGWRTGRPELVLDGNFDLLPAALGS
jgi:ATP-dependent Clp protease ATP-binding subunit ClpC